MRSLLLFLVVLGAFAAALFGALQLMDSGDAPAAVGNREETTESPALQPPPSGAPAKPTVAPQPRQSAAERSGDRWVNQAEAICRQFETDLNRLMQGGTPRSNSIALFRKAYGYERVAVTRLHGLKRPTGPDGPLVDRLLRVLDRHLSAFDAALDAVEARDGAQIQRRMAQLAALTEPTELAAAELGALTCAYGGGG